MTALEAVDARLACGCECTRAGVSVRVRRRGGLGVRVPPDQRSKGAERRGKVSAFTGCALALRSD